MECPKCHFQQQNREVCGRCGLVFEKYYQYHGENPNTVQTASVYTIEDKLSISQIPLVKRLNTLIFYGCLLLLIIGFFKRDNFITDFQYEPALAEEPLQTATDAPAFSVNKNAIDYRIQPLYQYQISGLVVSYRHHDGEYSLHKRWNDHLNIADICVVWGDNVEDLNLNAFSFWSGIFTCNVETKDRASWQQFNPNQLANNHLLTADDSIRDIIADVNVGDQIRITGSLANYANNKGFKRGTSTTRTDRGNGACETIFVEDFEIIRPSANPWHTVFNSSLLFMTLSFCWWIYSVARE